MSTEPAEFQPLLSRKLQRGGLFLNNTFARLRSPSHRRGLEREIASILHLKTLTEYRVEALPLRGIPWSFRMHILNS